MSHTNLVLLFWGFLSSRWWWLSDGVLQKRKKSICIHNVSNGVEAVPFYSVRDEDINLAKTVHD